MRIKSQRTKGFTLLELLTVLALIAVVAAVALAAYDGVGEQAEYDAAKVEMAEVRKALLQFRRDVGDFPADLLQLGSYSASAVTALGNTYAEWDKDAHRGWHGPYISRSFDKDPWGNSYLLLDPDDPTAADDTDGVARIVSIGPDPDNDNDGVLDDVENAASDSCDNIANSDDIVVCLLK